jgi:uncharacterized membrane protein YfcA
MDLTTIIILILAGLVAGFINTLAGSGSMITLPLLIFLGLPANVANGTNRIAIFLQSIVGLAKFQKKKVLHWKNGLYLSIIATVGAIFGAITATQISAENMETIIGILLFVMLFSIFLKPKKWMKEFEEGTTTKTIPWWNYILFLGIGFYGGFIQMSTGILILTSLVLGANYDLIRANALKLLIVILYTPFAIYIFYVNNQIDWTYGLVLAIGNIAGAWIAASLALKNGVAVVRWVLIITVLASAVKLLFF